jgi:hypothetical protein
MHVRHALRVLVTAGALAGLALPAAANAETFKHSDPTKDVQSFDDTSEATAQLTNKTADISHLTLRHTSQKLAVTVKLRDVAKTWDVVSQLETPDRVLHVVRHRHAILDGLLTGQAERQADHLRRAHRQPGQAEAHDHMRHPDLLLQLPEVAQGGRRRGRRIVDDVRRRRAARRRAADESNLALSRRIHRG